MMENTNQKLAGRLVNDPLWLQFLTLIEDGTCNVTSNTTSTFDDYKKCCWHPVVAGIFRIAYSTIHDTWRMIDSHTYLYTMTIIYGIVFAMGTVGNLLTTAVIYKTPNLHSNTNFFLCSLALSDFLLVVVGVPSDLFALWRPMRPPSFAGYCKAQSFLISWFTNISIATIIALTAERFIAICYPLHLRSYFDRARVLRIIKIVWCLTSMPALFVGVQYEQTSTNADPCGNRHPEYGGTCDLSPRTAIPYTFEAMLLLTFFIPMVFIVFCYARILRVLAEMAVATTVHSPVMATSSADSSNNGVLYIHTKNSGPHKSQQAQQAPEKL